MAFALEDMFQVYKIVMMVYHIWIHLFRALFDHLMLQIIIKCIKVKIERLPVGPNRMGFSCIFKLRMGPSSLLKCVL